MTAKLDYRWHLREVMAIRGMFSTTDLRPLLAERGIDLSASQVYRLVVERPERLSLPKLMALLDILQCRMDDLIEPVAVRAAQKKVAAAGGEGPDRCRPGGRSRPVTHRPLDGLRPVKVVDNLRQHVVDGGALTARDERLAALERWLPAKTAEVLAPESRRVRHTYITWHLLPDRAPPPAAGASRRCTVSARTSSRWCGCSTGSTCRASRSARAPRTSWTSGWATTPPAPPHPRLPRLDQPQGPHPDAGRR